MVFKESTKKRSIRKPFAPNVPAGNINAYKNKLNPKKPICQVFSKNIINVKKTSIFLTLKINIYTYIYIDIYFLFFK